MTATSDSGFLLDTNINYIYDAVGNLATVAYPNNVTHTYSYNTLNRLTNLAVSCGTAAPGCGPNGVANSATYQYTLGATGNRLNVAELSGRAVSYYGYDDLYRLTSEAITGAAAGKNGTVSYVYDAVGNRKQLNSFRPFPRARSSTTPMTASPPTSTTTTATP